MNFVNGFTYLLSTVSTYIISTSMVVMQKTLATFAFAGRIVTGSVHNPHRKHHVGGCSHKRMPISGGEREGIVQLGKMLRLEGKCHVLVEDDNRNR